jgi:hypothetical protein
MAAAACSILFLLAACSGDEPRRETNGSIDPSVAPVVSPTSQEPAALCQPFPDRLIDEFLATYNARDETALSELVRVDAVQDVSAVAFGGPADFETVGGWAEAGWAVDDRFQLTGYGAFAGTRDGFTMDLQRRNDALRAVGISEAIIQLHARSTGCTIDELRSVGPVQVRGEPCRFYDVFGDEPAIATAIPGPCADGTGAFIRQGHDAVWTGREMVVVGGTRGGHFFPADLPEFGLRYRPSADAWTWTSAVPRPVRSYSRAVWTGDEVIVWGLAERRRPSAAAYDPEADRWRLLPDWPLPRSDLPAGAWTGDRLILWGSSQHVEDPTRSGAIYDPATDSWERTSKAPIEGREGNTLVWTGREVIVWGGSNYRTDLGDGAAYNPAADTWRRIANAPLAPRQEHVAVWTGSEMLVWGGSSYSRARADGAAYDPTTDTWRRLAPPPIKGRHWLDAVWTGDQMIVWGGYDYHRPLGNGAAYDPDKDRWRRLPAAPIGARCLHSTVWTGRELVVFGGYDACGVGGHMAFGDGATYDPRTQTWSRLVPAP